MKMVHPDIDAVADVVDENVFNAVWAPRGWVLLGPAESHATEVLGRPVKDVEKLKVDELKGLLVTRPGQQYPGASVKKVDVIASYRDTFAEEPAPVGDTEVFAPAEPTPESAPADANHEGQ